MFEAKVSATCRFHTGSTGSPGRSWHRRPAPSAAAAAVRSAPALPQTMPSVWSSRARLPLGFYLAHCASLQPSVSLSLCLSCCLSVRSSRWPGDKFQVLVKQVIKVDLSTMGSFYTLPATAAAASTAVSSTAAASTAAAIVNRATF